MKMPWLAIPLCGSLACNAGPDPVPLTFPADDPGVKIIAPSYPFSIWAPIWDPQSGRLVIAVHTGVRLGTSLLYPVSFNILSYDPTEPTHPTTLVSHTEGGGLRALKFASLTGALYYQYASGSVPTNPTTLALRRVPAGGGAPTPVPTPEPLRDGFFISATESRLLSSSWLSSSQYLSNPATGQVLATVDAGSVVAMSSDASEILTGFDADKVITIATGATRTLSWRKPNISQEAVDAVWIGGRIRIFFTEMEALPQTHWRVSLGEWDEATGTRTMLGSLESSELLASVICAAWSPSTHSAVLLSDSVTDLTSDRYRSHRTIVAMSGATATTIGSQNFEELSFEGPTTCSLSPDGKWFAYRPSYAAVYLKAVK